MTDVKSKFANNNFRTRVISGVVIAILFFGLGIVGGPIWFALIAAVSMIALWEFYRVFGIEKCPAGIVGYALAAGYWALVYFGADAWMFPYLIGAFIAEMGVYVIDYEHMKSDKAMAAVIGLLYAVVMVSFLYRIRTMEDGAWIVWLTCLSSWGCDVCAYMVGVMFGKHKMAPILSPKKSVEGAVGGLVGSGLIGVIYGAVLRTQSGALKTPILACTVICVLAAAISMIGDLTASAYKRDHGIKDYSHVIPGHGGILDRFDSVIFVAPIVFYLAGLFM